MSGPIKKLIGPAKARLQRYIEEASSLLVLRIEEKSSEEDEIRVEEVIARINTNVSLLERCNRDWSSLLRDLKSEERSKEEKEYQRVADGSEGYIEILMDANEMVVRLQGRLKSIVRAREQSRTKTLPVSKEPVGSIMDPSVSLNSGGHNLESSSFSSGELGAFNLKVNLPKLQLPIFDGKIQQWQEFWDIFNSTIHEQQTLSAVSKFNYLKSVLKGSALSAIVGIPLTNDNYALAVRLLQEKFGQKEAIVGVLYSRLQNLPKASNKFVDIQRTSETIEKLLRQLEAQGEFINEQRILIQQIISKYPSEVIVKLEETKEPVVPWSVKSLRKAIGSYIAIQENVQRYVSTNNPNVRGQENVQRYVSTNNPNVRGQENVQHYVSTNNPNVRGQSFTSRQTRSQSDSQRPFTETLVTNVQRKSTGNQTKASLPCLFCRGCHFNDMCDKFITLAGRKQVLNQQRRCYICLKVGHVSKDCPSSQKKSCCYCGKKGSHNRCLCPQKFTRQVTESFMTTGCNVSSDGIDATVACTEFLKDTDDSINVVDSNTTPMLLASGEKVLLQIATVPIQKVDGSVTVMARVLLDSASQRTFMTDRLAKQLKLVPEYKELLSVSTFGVEKASNIDTYVVHFRVKTKDGSHMLMFANVLNQITGNIKRGPLHQKDLDFLQLIPQSKMADPIPNTVETTAIDLLVGSDYFWEVVGGDKMMLPSEIFMLPSKFGYIITGRYPGNGLDSRDKGASTLLVSASGNEVVSPSFYCSVNVSVIKNPDLERFWSLETIGIKDPISNESDEEAIEKFCNTIKFEEGRYQITWPWKLNGVSVSDNFEVALRRMKSLVRRLQSDADLLQIYDGIIKQQLNQGIIERVDDDVNQHIQRYYMPHHPVLTPKKATTKVRIVYDASSKAESNMNSLNECLHRGPVILPDLCGLLIRFRTYPVVVLADIEKAFLQVGIQEAERDVTRFLWLKDLTKVNTQENLITYRFCRVPFGLVCSPFLLGATIKFHLQREGSPLALHILRNIYVDNVLIGINSINEICGVYEEAKSLFKRAAMNLRQWNSNCRESLEFLPNCEKSVASDSTSVLGLSWNCFEDTINISGCDKIVTFDVTKRDVLHSVAAIFDPLGLLSPITFHGKIFLQKLWVADKPWDESLSMELLTEWKKVAQLLRDISRVRIPRFIGKVTEESQLLIFCDASIKAYATTLYLRVNDGTKFRVNLLFSKMRLVPIAKKRRTKDVIIPRLELLAVLIGVRAANFVLRELEMNISKRILWSDSQCVLHWLKTRKPLSMFVENRVKEILKEKDISFRYILSEQNPADIATRGSNAFEIAQSDLWWHGPSWLEKEELVWPMENFSYVDSEVMNHINGERKGCKELVTVAGNNKKIDEKRIVSLFGMNEKDYSSLRKLLRVSVYIMRCIKERIWNRLSAHSKERFQKQKLLMMIFNNLKNSSPVTFQEIKLLSLLWISFIQHRQYSDVYVAIKNNKKHCLQMQLGLKISEYGILRCHGRYQHSELAEEMKYPKLLPRYEHFTYLVIQEIHRRLIHAGASHTLSQARQEYWIPQGRAMVRHVISQCVICKRHNGPSFCLPNMPPWPKERVLRSTPFQYIGLDYLGPIRVKEGGIIEKMWICLFTCLAVRAVHLELVRGLSAQQFLDCLRRYIARRGRPEMIISDNAPQFKLVKTVIDQQWSEIFRSGEVLHFFSNEGITWKYTTALAPWQGGFYERLVSLVKQGLRKGIGRKLLSWDRLLTMVTEVEAIINTRPLTYVYGDFMSGFTLTPAHFLTGNLDTVIPFGSDGCEDVEFRPKRDSSQDLTNYWRKSQKQLDQFWEAWRQNYLLALREKLPLSHKKHRLQISGQPKIGEIVLVKEDNLPRRTWKLALIKDYILSKDGEIRSVYIQLPNKQIVSRAINHLFPLEIQVESENKVEPRPLEQMQPDTDQEDSRPLRRATVLARKRIGEQLNDQAVTVVFSFPGECREEREDRHI